MPAADSLCRSPKEIESLRDKRVTQVDAGSTCSFALTAAGDAYAWGFGENLQLSTGEEAGGHIGTGAPHAAQDAIEPTLMTGKTLEARRVVQVVAGGQHTAILAVNKA